MHTRINRCVHNRHNRTLQLGEIICTMTQKKPRIMMFGNGGYGWNSVFISAVDPSKPCMSGIKENMCGDSQEKNGICHLLQSEELLPFPGSQSPFFSPTARDQILDRPQVNGHHR